MGTGAGGCKSALERMREREVRSSCCCCHPYPFSEGSRGKGVVDYDWSIVDARRRFSKHLVKDDNLSTHLFLFPAITAQSPPMALCSTPSPFLIDIRESYYTIDASPSPTKTAQDTEQRYL